ncbi:MAG: Crp/Fnr family transcriptional regulator [Chitinophagales bacterium]|nr:Crp/Fnr family transcriptional regulator [Chitinophagales bacterium]
MSTQETSIDRLFPQLETELRAEINGSSAFKEVKEGEVLMQTGQYIKSSVLLLSGLLKVYREDAEGNEFFMYHIEPGTACALSMLCAARNEKSQIKMKAVTDSEIALIPIHLADTWVNKYKSWYQFVVATYRERFDELLQTLDNIAFKGLDERLLFYLKRHYETAGALLNINHQQIAQELNSSREVISRLLKKLEMQGVVKLNRNSVEILNPQKLSLAY